MLFNVFKTSGIVFIRLLCFLSLVFLIHFLFRLIFLQCCPVKMVKSSLSHPHHQHKMMIDQIWEFKNNDNNWIEQAQQQRQRQRRQQQEEQQAVASTWMKPTVLQKHPPNVLFVPIQSTPSSSSSSHSTNNLSFLARPAQLVDSPGKINVQMKTNGDIQHLINEIILLNGLQSAPECETTTTSAKTSTTLAKDETIELKKVLVKEEEEQQQPKILLKNATVQTEEDELLQFLKKVHFEISDLTKKLKSPFRHSKEKIVIAVNDDSAEVLAKLSAENDDSSEEAENDDLGEEAENDDCFDNHDVLTKDENDNELAETENEMNRPKKQKIFHLEIKKIVQGCEKNHKEKKECDLSTKKRKRNGRGEGTGRGGGEKRNTKWLIQEITLDEKRKHENGDETETEREGERQKLQGQTTDERKQEKGSAENNESVMEMNVLGAEFVEMAEMACKNELSKSTQFPEFIPFESSFSAESSLACEIEDKDEIDPENHHNDETRAQVVKSKRNQTKTNKGKIEK